MEHQRYCLPYDITTHWHFPRLTIIPLWLLVVLLTAPPSLHADNGPHSDKPLAARSPSPEAEYLILDVFDTLKRAQTRAAIARQQGGEVRVRAERVPVTLDNLRLGDYSDSAVATEAIVRLQKHGIRSQLIGSAGNGYAVSIGVFSETDYAQQMLDRLKALGFDNVQITHFQVIKTRYVVEKKLAPEATGAPTPAAPAGGAAPPVVNQVPPPPATHVRPAGRKEARDAVSWGVGLDSTRFETGWLTSGSQPVDGSHYVHVSADARMLISHQWEFRLAGRLDGYYQTGIPGVQTTHVDYDESYIRYHGKSSRITAGAQTVIWGRTDEIPPNDRMSVQDLSRFILDDLPQRRRAVPALRIEEFAGPYKADLLWVPEFRPAELPSFDNIWSPVDRDNGRIISIKRPPC